MTMPLWVPPILAICEFSDAELRAAIELFDLRELETLAQKIYAANGGLH